MNATTINLKAVFLAEPIEKEINSRYPSNTSQ